MIKIVKDAQGNLISYGPDDENYDPTIPEGCALEIVSEEEDEELIAQFNQRLSIPRVVTMRQARVALLQAGLLATVNTAINSGGEADKIEWEYAANVDRNSPLVQNMKSGLSLSDADLDNLFTLAASL